MLCIGLCVRLKPWLCVELCVELCVGWTEGMWWWWEERGPLCSKDFGSYGKRYAETVGGIGKHIFYWFLTTSSWSEPIGRNLGKEPVVYNPWSSRMAGTHCRNPWSEHMVGTHGRNTWSEPIKWSEPMSEPVFRTHGRNPYDRNPLLERVIVAHGRIFVGTHGWNPWKPSEWYNLLLLQKNWYIINGRPFGLYSSVKLAGYLIIFVTYAGRFSSFVSDLVLHHNNLPWRKRKRISHIVFNFNSICDIHSLNTTLL